LIDDGKISEEVLGNEELNYFYDILGLFAGNQAMLE